MVTNSTGHCFDIVAHVVGCLEGVLTVKHPSMDMWYQG